MLVVVVVVDIMVDLLMFVLEVMVDYDPLKIKEKGKKSEKGRIKKHFFFHECLAFI